MQQDDSGPSMEELIDKVIQGNNFYRNVFTILFFMFAM